MNERNVNIVLIENIINELITILNSDVTSHYINLLSHVGLHHM